MEYWRSAKALPGKSDRHKYHPVQRDAYHRGFYCDNNDFETLEDIEYDGHLTHNNYNEEHLTSAGCLLRGSCQAFALKIKEILGYKAFIIQEYEGDGFMYFV